jgi:hypothetical protein
MYSFLTQEALSGAVEIACYFSTAVAVFVSFLLNMRF